MLKAVYLREGPDAAVRSAKYMVEAAAIVIAEELGPAETRRFLHVVGLTPRTRTLTAAADGAVYTSKTDIEGRWRRPPDGNNRTQ